MGRQDIAVLSELAPARRPIVYVYRTGVFISRMKKYVRAQAEASGQLVEWLHPSGLGNHLALPSLLGAKPLAAVDLGEKGNVSWLIADAVSEASLTVAAILIDEKNRACASEAFASILGRCDLVVETPFDRLHIREILKFLQERSDITVDVSLAERSDVINHFATLVETTDCWTIVNAFDAMLASAPGPKWEIDFEAYGAPIELRRPTLIPVMVKDSPLAAEEFMFEVARSLRLGAPREQVVREVCNTVTAQLKLALEQLKDPPKTTSSVSPSTVQLVNFALRTLAWIETLSMKGTWRDPILGPDEFLWNLNVLVSVETDSVPMPVHNIPTTLARMERRGEASFLPRHFARISSHLKSYLTELSQVANPRWAVADVIDLFRASLSVSTSNCSFADEGPTYQLQDQGRIGEKLLRLPCNDFSSPTVILYGPSETQLSKLARAYAKSILCETSAMNSWCGTCPSCLQFENRTLLGRIEPIDLGHCDAKTRVERLVEILRTPSLADRTAVTLFHAEAAGPIILDTLLKTVEEPPSRTSFIIMSRDLDTLSPAVRSRAYVIKVS